MTFSDACWSSGVDINVSNTSRAVPRIAPSTVFSATLPVKPSVTITSTVSCMKSRPSTLPTNPGMDANMG